MTKPRKPWTSEYETPVMEASHAAQNATSYALRKQAEKRALKGAVAQHRRLTSA